MTNDTILALSEIQTYMAQHHILQGITFNVKSGRVTTLLGRNGAGKSSTLKTIMGLYPPQAGEITFAGEAIQGMEPYEVAQRGVGFVPEDQAIFYHLTVEENMTLAMLDDNPKTQERCDRMLNLFPDLKKILEIKRRRSQRWTETNAGNCPLHGQ